MRFGMSFLTDFLETIVVATLSLSLSTTFVFRRMAGALPHARRLPLPLGSNAARPQSGVRPARRREPFRSSA
jgi:hypothetical protein